MQNRAALLAAAFGIAAAAACGSSSTTTVKNNPPPPSKIVNFTASLMPGNEPSTTGNPTGSGTFTATLDTSTNVFTYDVRFSGLTSNVTLGHIHGPFTPGATFVGLKTATSGSATGTVVLTAATSFTATVNGDSLKKLLLAGLTYANIHTVTNGGGEIRGQITVVH